MVEPHSATCCVVYWGSRERKDDTRVIEMTETRSIDFAFFLPFMSSRSSQICGRHGARQYFIQPATVSTLMTEPITSNPVSCSSSAHRCRDGDD
jgi:hypothetical protein